MRTDRRSSTSRLRCTCSTSRAPRTPRWSSSWAGWPTPPRPPVDPLPLLAHGRRAHRRHPPLGGDPAPRLAAAPRRERPGAHRSAESLAGALDSITHEFGIAVRSGIIGFLDRPAAIDVASWERAWLDVLAWWIDAAPAGARPPAPRSDARRSTSRSHSRAPSRGRWSSASLHGGPAPRGLASRSTTGQVVRLGVPSWSAGLSTDGSRRAGGPGLRPGPPSCPVSTAGRRSSAA